MRTIDRTAEKTPSALADIVRVQNAVDKYQTTGKLSSALCTDISVIEALKRLSNSKCYLCESDASLSGVVEHFLPHHRKRAQRASDWKNLHWTCDKCNGRKVRKGFKEFVPNTNIIEKTLLIDPTDPSLAPVEERITFDNELNATPTHGFQADDVVRKTAEFLNDPIPLNERNRVYKVLAHTLIEASCHLDWQDLIKIKNLDPTQFVDPHRDRLLRAMDYADRVYLNFLLDRNPFSTALKRVMEDLLRVPVSRIVDMGRAYRQFKGLPSRY